jgi:hypothetical protein
MTGARVNEVAGSPDTSMAGEKRQESNGYREISRLAARERL